MKKVINAIELEVVSTLEISDIYGKAAAIANDKKLPVHFTFNGIDVVVIPERQEKEAQERWHINVYTVLAKPEEPRKGDSEFRLQLRRIQRFFTTSLDV